MGIDQPRRVEDLHLTDAWYIIDRQKRVDFDLGAGFLQGFAAGPLGG